MRQDSDVARVAAAMNAPGFKYRSFGNEPVRIRPGAAGTLAQPQAEPAGFAADSMPASQGYPMESFATEPQAPLARSSDLLPAEPGLPEPLRPEPLLPEPFLPEPFLPDSFLPEPLAYDHGAAARFAYESFPEAAPEPQPAMAEPVPVAPEPPPPAAPLFSWPETPATLPPAPVAAAPPSAMPEAPPAYAMMPERVQPPLSAGGFRLLESMGHRPAETATQRIDAAAGGTLGLLRRAAETGAGGSSTMAGIGFGEANPGPMPPLSPPGHQSGLLPAAAVTVPLSDVMRLIAAGATPPPSPFDAFRAALGAQPGR